MESIVSKTKIDKLQEREIKCKLLIWLIVLILLIVFDFVFKSKSIVDNLKIDGKSWVCID